LQPSSDRVPPGVSEVKPTAVDDDGSDADDFEANIKPDDDKVVVPEPSGSMEGFTGDEDNEEQRAYYARKVTGEKLARDPKAYVPYVPLREKQIDDLGRAYGTGKRKTSIARVWIKDGSGVFIVNDKRFVEYFDSMQRESCLESFMASKTAGLFDVWCTVKGGGVSGDSELCLSEADDLFTKSYLSCCCYCCS
jgi:Ribosomal protein S9/S16